ncbi:hypothetical protein [Halobacteriovorax sp. HLS]|uniref:hypothetical protein n=1 Tax=Halobacteriovorax sp. HLS TaxID=2234000 RepID=UPI000FD769AB|nr:hypothetical protein [Halobacteriovorax sp. HLS]
MKSNKKMLLLLAISMASPWQLANAGALDDIEIVNSAGSGSSGSSGTVNNDSATSNIEVSEIDSSSVENKNCPETLEKNNVLSMRVLKYMSGGVLPKITPHNDKQFKISLESFPAKCVTLQVNRILDEDNNHIFRFVNTKDYASDGSDFIEGKSNIPTTMEGKFASCLKKHYGEKDPSSGKYKFDMNSSKLSNSTSFMSLHSDLDKNKSSRILFASPSNVKNDYFTYDTKVISDKNEIWKCSSVQAYGDSSEDAKKEGYTARRIYRSEADKQWERARAACEIAKDGDIYAIKRLIDKDTGNRSDLQQKIKEVYLKLIEKNIASDADAIREKIEEKLQKITKYDNAFSKGDKKKAAVLAKEIAALSREYDEKVIKPSREVLESAHAEYENLSEDDIDSPRREVLETRIETITEKLAEFSDVDMVDGVEVMKIHNKSKAGESLLRASKGSEYLSRACLDCEEQMDFEDVDDALAARIKKFKKSDKRDWSFVSQAARGKETPLYLTRKLYDNSQNSMRTAYSNYQQNEQKQYQQYCASSMFGGMKNPVRCQYFQNSAGQRQRMFQSKMSSMQRDMEGYNQKYSYYQSYYDGAQRYLSEQDRDIASVGPGGSVYDSFDILRGTTGNQSDMYNMGMPQFAAPLMTPR